MMILRKRNISAIASAFDRVIGATILDILAISGVIGHVKYRNLPCTLVLLRSMAILKVT
jgi:hypothetical protein